MSATGDNAVASSTNALPDAKTKASNTEQKSKYVSAEVLNKTNKPRRKRPRRTDRESDSEDDEPGWNITPETKKRIEQSSWLRKELQDGGLRHLIEMIDAASDDEEEDDAADNANTNDNQRPTHKRKNNFQRRNNNSNANSAVISPRALALARVKYSHPKFASFMDQLMLTAGVLMPAEEGGDRDLGALLKEAMGEGESTHGQLVLAPVPRRSGNMNASVNSDDSAESEDDSDSEDSDDGSSSSEESEGGEKSDG